MKIFKLAIISIIGLFLVILAFSLLLPSQVIISRAIDIYAPLTLVYNPVNDLSKWPLWMDNFDSAKTEVSARPQGANAFIKMESIKVIITESQPKKIVAIWQSGQNRELPGEFNFITSDSANYVTIQWQFTQKVKWYPWEKFASIVSDRALGPTMEKSLDNLKKMVENKGN